MPSEYVNMVLNAEALANKAISDAKIKCSGIISDAERFSEKLMNQKVHDAELSCKTLKTKNIQLCEAFKAETDLNFNTQKDNLLKQFEENSASAEETVTSLILNF